MTESGFFLSQIARCLLTHIQTCHIIGKYFWTGEW